MVENLPEWLPQLLVACGETLKLTLVSFVLAAVGGVLVALLRRSSNRVASRSIRCRWSGPR